MTTARTPRHPAKARDARLKHPDAKPSEEPEPPSARQKEDPGATQPAEALAQATERASGLPPQMAKILGTIIAPTTLLTTLLYYFGWSHAYWFCNYFGVNSTVLGFTTTDYLMRSVDALFVPMTVAASVAILAAWGHSVLRARLAAGSRPRALRLMLPVMAIAGSILFVGGFISVFTTTFLSNYLVAAPLSFGGGVLLLVYTVHLRRLIAEKRELTDNNRRFSAVAEWTAIFVLVGLSLFWAATNYSAAVGRSRAMDFVAGLPTYPNVVIYSERSLSLDAPGVQEVRCKDPQAEYRFRYDGLKLVLESGGQYLFLPTNWTPASGVAILLPQSSSTRLEFSPPRPQLTGEPATC